MPQATLEPLGDRLTVERLPEEKITAGGIILPDQAQEKPHRGVIVHVGPLCGQHLREGETPLVQGDEVLFSRYGGHEIQVDLVDLVLLRESDVFGRLRYAPEPATEVGGNGDAMAEFGYGELTEASLRAAVGQYPDDTELVVGEDLAALGRALTCETVVYGEAVDPAVSGLTLRIDPSNAAGEWRLVQPAGQRGGD